MKVKTMDIILIIIFIMLIAFTLQMVSVYRDTGGIPDTLVTCVFAAMGGEFGIMGWIKTTKDKYQERQWAKEDEAAEKAAGDTKQSREGGEMG